MSDAHKDFLRRLVQSTEEEYDQFHSLERELEDDLDQVRDVEHNLKVLERQMSSFERIVKERDRLYGEIKNLMVDSSSSSLDDARSYLHHLDKLDRRVGKLMTRILGRVEDVHMDEVKELLDEPGELKEVLRRAAGQAEDIQERLSSFKERFRREAGEVDSLRKRLKQGVRAETA
ncbi:MAG: hypothetical protein ACLFO2_01795 [Candidatus Woesearchaeota archaeon]